MVIPRWNPTKFIIFRFSLLSFWKTFTDFFLFNLCLKLELVTLSTLIFFSLSFCLKTFPLIRHDIHTRWYFELKFVQSNDFIEYLRNGIDSSVVRRWTDCWVESRISPITFENETLDSCENIKKMRVAAGKILSIFYCWYNIFLLFCVDSKWINFMKVESSFLWNYKCFAGSKEVEQLKRVKW